MQNPKTLGRVHYLPRSALELQVLPRRPAASYDWLCRFLRASLAAASLGAICFDWKSLLVIVQRQSFAHEV